MVFPCKTKGQLMSQPFNTNITQQDKGLILGLSSSECSLINSTYNPRAYLQTETFSSAIAAILQIKYFPYFSNWYQGHMAEHSFLKSQQFEPSLFRLPKENHPVNIEAQISILALAIPMRRQNCESLLGESHIWWRAFFSTTYLWLFLEFLLKVEKYKFDM